MTRRISPVAVCCSRASVRSRLRVSSSCEQRARSRCAMTAWAAKVSSSAISLSENACGSRRDTAMAPTPAGAPPRDADPAPIAADRARRRDRSTHPVSSCISRTWIVRRSRTIGPALEVTCQRTRISCFAPRSSRSGGRLCVARRWISSPSDKTTMEKYPSHSRTACRDHVQHGLDVRRRATHDAQDLACRRLLLQGLRERALPLRALARGVIRAACVLSSCRARRRTCRSSRAIRASASALVCGGPRAARRLLTSSPFPRAGPRSCRGGGRGRWAWCRSRRSRRRALARGRPPSRARSAR